MLCAEGVADWGGGDSVPAGLHRLGQRRGIPGAHGQFPQSDADVVQAGRARSGWPAG